MDEIKKKIRSKLMKFTKLANSAKFPRFTKFTKMKLCQCNPDTLSVGLILLKSFNLFCAFFDVLLLKMP